MERYLLLSKTKLGSREASLINGDSDQPIGVKLEDEFCREKITFILDYDEIMKLLPFLAFWFEEKEKKG